MLAEQRYAGIMALLEEFGSVTVQTLSEKLATSESTIRRDLSVLDKQGRLRKVFGGATIPEKATVTKDDVVSIRQSRFHEEKRRIVQAAAELIGPDDFVFLDAGTTTALLAEEVSANGATWVTNAVLHARTLALKGCRVFLTGGELKPVTEAVVGSRVMEDLGRYNFSLGFFGTNGISLARGFSTPDDSEAMVKSYAMKRCGKCYVLADPSKFGAISSVTFAPFAAADIITTAVDDPVFRESGNLREVDRR